jgi:hypothetical protein
VILITVLVAVVSLAAGLLVLTKIRNQLIDASKEEYQQQQSLLADQVVENCWPIRWWKRSVTIW